MGKKHDELCEQITTYCDILKKTKDFIFFHYPAEGIRNYSYYQRHKKLGYKAGISDFVFIKSNSSIFLEVKIGKDKLNNNQKEFAEECKQKNMPFLVVRTFDEFLIVFENFINDKLR